MEGLAFCAAVQIQGQSWLQWFDTGIILRVPHPGCTGYKGYSNVMLATLQTRTDVTVQALQDLPPGQAASVVEFVGSAVDSVEDTEGQGAADQALAALCTACLSGLKVGTSLDAARCRMSTDARKVECNPMGWYMRGLYCDLIRGICLRIAAPLVLHVTEHGFAIGGLSNDQ